LKAIRLFAFAFWGHWLIGGSERRFLEVSKRFRNSGIDIYALEATPTFRNIGINPPYTGLLEVRKFNRLRLFFLLLYLTPKALWYCRKNRCNLIYVSHHYLFENVLSGFLVSYLLQKPFIVVFNGSLSPFFHSSFSSSFIYHRKTGESLLSSLYFSFIESFEASVCRRASACIAVSRSLEREIKQEFNLKNSVVVGNGVDTSEISFHFRRNKSYDAIFVGWLHPDKGIETLLKAWKIVTTKRKSSKLLIVGKAKTDALQERYETLIKEQGLADNVTMVGQVISRKAISELYNQSKIFVLPSKSEGYPLTIMEAMACSLPCVVSDLPALRENFEGVAYFVNPDDAEGFAKAILGLLENPDERESMGHEGYSHVRRLTWERISEKEIEIFQNLLTPAHNMRSKYGG
jgi:glycosyltransferase involved in cell wall biosynthesis